MRRSKTPAPERRAPLAELTPQERLQPSLLDRLTDDEPGSTKESREKRVLSMRRLRASVLRDLGWLLNTGNLLAAEDLDPYPDVAKSVLNYGLPDFSGVSASSVNVPMFERALRQAIWEFEPRILRDTVKVRLLVNEDEMNHNAMSFEIQGELWAQPVPLRLFLKTEIDLETGAVSIEDEGSY